MTPTALTATTMGSPVKHFVRAAALALFVLPLHAAPAAILTGIAQAKDGDGILFGEVEVRLQGIAAPEFRSNKKEAGGREALMALGALVNGEHVHCELDGTTANRRPVGICYLDGRDLGRLMIESGFARDCPRFSRGRYSDVESNAQHRGRDLSKIYGLPDYC